MIVVGTAGWSIARHFSDRFPQKGSGLERYASVFKGAEINSTFYRPHRTSTYAGWAASVPDDFRFAAKLPKTITHNKRLVDAMDATARFVEEVRGLGDKLGPLLIQLPPSLRFDPGAVESFLTGLRARFDGALVCEPRHASWFTDEAEALLIHHVVARVAADPALSPEAARPGGFAAPIYVRLHGSPRMYYSAYDPAFLDDLSRRLRASVGAVTWCVFDNTASGAALDNALALQDRLRTAEAQSA